MKLIYFRFYKKRKIYLSILFSFFLFVEVEIFKLKNVKKTHKTNEHFYVK